MEVPLALVFDSDPAVRARTAEALRAAGLEPVEAASPQDALEAFRARAIAVAALGRASAREAMYEIVERGLRLRPTAVVAVLQGEGAGHALEAVRAGAFEVLPRAADRERLELFAIRAVAQHRLLEELRRLRSARAPEPLASIGGRSEAVEALRVRLVGLADSPRPVLFVGEEGSGRRNAARALHALRGTTAEFVSSDDPGAESRLFAAAPGASRGLHLAPLEALPWRLQERLAGSLGDAARGRRLTASAGHPPEALVAQGRLAPPLAAAFGDGVVAIAPLRERREDVAVLARAFVEGLRELNALPPIAFEAEAVEALEAWSWPGNVLELRNAVESAVILAPDGRIRLADLPAALRGGPGGAPPGVRADRRFREAKKAMVDAFERAYLSDLLRQSGGNVTGAAQLSGMLRSALQRLLRKHDLRSNDFRGPLPEEQGDGTA